jgi:hypothetical protein
MAGIAAALDVPQTRRLRWIVSPRYDTFFFIGSCVFTLIFLGIYHGAQSAGLAPRGEAVLLTYFLFTALFDHPHIFQTLSRTHFDKREFAKRRFLYTWGLAGFIAAGFALTAAGYEAELIVFASVFGTFHIIRQHWGLLKAYKIINDDLDPIDGWLDGLVFYVGTFACFFNDYADIRGPIVIYEGLQARFPSLPQNFGTELWSLFLVLLSFWGLRQAWRVGTGKSLNVPKVLLMSAALSTHYLVFFATATPFLVAEALETVYHDVQYQGWIAHYQRRCHANVKRVVLKWFVCAMAYGIVVGAIEVLGFMRMSWAVWLFVPFTMIVLYHYYVDGLIWRFRESPELRALLKPSA